MNKAQVLIILLILLLLPSALALGTNFTANGIAYTVTDGVTGQSNNLTNFTDGSYTTYIRSVGGAASLNITYLKADFAISGTWRVRGSGDSVDGVNLSIPSDCWNYNPVYLKLRATVTLNPMTNQTWWYCANSTGLHFLHSGGVGLSDGNSLWEEDMTFTTEAGNFSCPGHPADPIYAEDDFDYLGITDNCYWYNHPVNGIAPTAGKLCYDASSTPNDFEYSLNGEGNLYSDTIFTEEFDLTPNQGTYIEKTFTYSPIGFDGPTPYRLIFSATESGSSVSYIEVVNGTSTMTSICADCLTTNTTNHIKITIYGPLASGYTILNGSTLQTVLPNTTAIQIGTGAVYFNLPNIETPSNNYYLPRRSGWDAYDGYFCLDNYVIYKGVANAPEYPVNETGIPFLQVGEPCSVNWECYTGYCDFLGSCAKKAYRESCASNYECQSDKCVNGLCTRPSLSKTLDNAKDDAVGTDAASSNILSLILALVIGIVWAIIIYKLGGENLAAIGGGVVFVVACFLFTLMGWLSPFIMVGLVILLILLIVFFVIMAPGG